jgi:hypothetical protein
VCLGVVSVTRRRGGIHYPLTIASDGTTTHSAILGIKASNVAGLPTVTFLPLSWKYPRHLVFLPNQFMCSHPYASSHMHAQSIIQVTVNIFAPGTFEVLSSPSFLPETHGICRPRLWPG